MSEFDKNEIARLKKENEELKEKLKPSKKKVNREEELYALNKKEQIDLITELGGTTIPKYEKDRVRYILELEG